MGKKKHSARSSQQKFCLICEKPHRRKTKLCSVCDKKRKELDLSIRSALYLKDVLKKNHGDDFWEYVETYPQTCYSILRYSSREERAERRRERTKLYGSQEYAARQYDHQRDNLPMYIQEIVKKLPSSIEFQEVQGQQHLKYIPYFHASEQDFEYQKYKDRVKKEFALKSGYKMLYIYYSEIVKGTYKEKIDDACEEEAIKFIE